MLHCQLLCAAQPKFIDLFQFTLHLKKYATNIIDISKRVNVVNSFIPLSGGVVLANMCACADSGATSRESSANSSLVLSPRGLWKKTHIYVKLENPKRRNAYFSFEWDDYSRKARTVQYIIYIIVLVQVQI